MTSQLVSGNTLGRYELLIPIAKGGMAQVWAARLRGTRGFQKLVAVKTILAGAMDSTRLEQMFLAEAQLAAEVHHPNVVGTLELGEHEGMLYLVMEWVDGEPVSHLLTQALEHGGLPIPIAVNLIAQACQGLHAAHELRDDSGNLLGVVHRDVSPQNLLVTLQGTAKLVDFGVAKATARAGNLTEVGEIKGKFSYMAPEQVQSQHVDRRADIFALGILAYLLTTGKHPFRGASPGETVRNIMSSKAPAAPSAMMPDYPAELEAVIMKALEESPERRFATAEDMFAALELAMPEALETSFQTQVASYMSLVMGARVGQRRAAIRQAQEATDRQRNEQGPSSIGTLRAISLDSIPDSSITPAKAQGASSLAAADDSGHNPFTAASSSKRYVAGGLSLLAVFAAGFALRLGPSPSTSVGAGAAQLEAVVLPSAASVSAPAPAVTPPAPALSAPVASSEPERENSKKPRPARGQIARGAAAPPLATPVVSAAPPAGATAPAAPPPPVKAAPSTNAWDRDAFGGRH
jgi:serine/threonine-protein kinase